MFHRFPAPLFHLNHACKPFVEILESSLLDDQGLAHVFLQVFTLHHALSMQHLVSDPPQKSLPQSFFYKYAVLSSSYRMCIQYPSALS